VSVVSVRVRFAPSPTGALHPGSARTVLFNWLFARHRGGKFILRIEDTDRSRQGEGSLESILEGIRWLGLEWDEGPEVGGPHAPYFQSQRLEHYQEAARRLREAGSAYYCFCTPERLDALRQEQARSGKPTRYDRHCLGLSHEEIENRLAAGEKPVVRMLIPEGRTEVKDLLRNLEPVDNHSQDDQIILKSDGFPTYHLASTVDDHLMEISHVIRGDEWLGSFPKHLILYRMLGWEPPLYAHVPVVLGPDRSKLSKRHGAASILEYRDLGYLPEAMVNFLAFLGWSPGTGEEFFTLDRLVEAFELEKAQTSPAIFNIAKLDSVNGQHIRALNPADLTRRLEPFTPGLSPELRERAAPLVQERIHRLTEAGDLLAFLVKVPEELPSELVPARRGADEAAVLLRDIRAIFAEAEVGPELEPRLRRLADELGWSARELFMTLGAALTGRRVYPPLLPSAQLLGREECLRRLDRAIDQLAAAPAG
jgi:glutamyl-tRNA synthetase